MTKYEMLYMLENSSTDEVKNAEIEKYENIVKSMGGNIISTDKWGTKKLAYNVKFKSEAYYVLMTFESNGDVVSELTRVTGIDSEVLRCMITKLA